MGAIGGREPGAQLGCGCCAVARSNIAGFPGVVEVRGERRCLGGKAGAASLSLSRFGDRLPGGLGPRHSAPAGDLVERNLALASKPEG